MKKPFYSLLKSKPKDSFFFPLPALRRAKYKPNNPDKSLDLNELADDYLELLKLKSKLNFEELNSFYTEEVNKWNFTNL